MRASKTGRQEVSPEDEENDFWTWMSARSYPHEKVVSEDSDALLAYRRKYVSEKVPPADRTYSCNYCGTKLTPENLIQTERVMEGFLVYSCPQCQNDAKIDLQRVSLWIQRAPAERHVKKVMKLAPIDVPMVADLPKMENDLLADEDDPWIVPYADWLLNEMLRRAPAALMAEMSDPSVAQVHWRYTESIVETDPGIEFDATPQRLFRTVLARFAHHYLGGQLYGGACERILDWNAGSYFTKFELSNRQQTGFFIRVAATPIPHSTADKNTNT